MRRAHQSCQKPSEKDKVQREVEEQLLQSRLAEIDHRLLVLSGKGGVGKSTVAANLATALAQAGKRVGLLDIDVHGPSIPKLLGVEGHDIRGVGDEMIPVRVSDNLAVMSVGFLLRKGSDAVIWRGPMKHGVIRQFLKDVAWGKLDYLVVDSPPGTGDEPLSVAQLIGSPVEAIVVTTPQEVAIADVRRCIGFCRTLSLPVMGIVENMSGFVCPRCGERVDLFKRGGGMALAREMDVPFLGQIPVDPEVVMAGDAGISLLRGGPPSAAGQAFAKVVDEILAADDQQRHQDKTEKDDHKRSCLRIVVPLVAGEPSPRLGACEELALFEVDRQTRQILDRSIHKAPKHLPGVLPRRLNELKVDVVLAAEMGDKTQKLLEEQGMQVVLDVPPKKSEELVLDYLNEHTAASRPAEVR